MTNTDFLQGDLLKAFQNMMTVSTPIENKIALFHRSEKSYQRKILTYGELHKLMNRIASGLVHSGFKPGDTIIIYMPFTIESIAAYLAIVKTGMVVVSVADSFSPAELKKR